MKKYDLNKIGYIITNLREEKKFKVKELAEVLNITATAYAHYEKGRRIPPTENLVKLAELYNVSVDYLLGNDTDEKNTSPLPHEVKEVQEAMLNLSPDKRTKAVAILRGAFPEAFAKQNADEFFFTNVADAREFLVSQGALMFADTGVISDEDIIKIANEQWEKNK